MFTPWQQEALETLLGTPVKQVEETRVYTSSATYGDSRYHLLSKRPDGVQIEQTNIEEKWGSRMMLMADELPAVLSTLLSWYLHDLQEAQARAQDTNGREDEDAPF